MTAAPDPLSSAEIARRFLAHFEARQHTVVPSASLIAPDPTLLLVNAGMVPFKPYFLGQEAAPYPRATSVQKCVRTLDIENVGRTARHGSFFQMCGNFSFGDYFKERAIPLAWELLTTPVADGGFGFPTERLWATVYLDDDEAADIWSRSVGLPADRLQRRGKEDNYWSMGVPGPCGPCSEIYYDRGPEFGREGGPVADEDRYLEVWNLVFMQYERGPGAGYDYPVLGELPKQNIDTGMGLERMATVLQGVDNLYETDLLRPVLNRAAEITGTRYRAAPDSDVSLRVVAEHTRTAVMLIGDGVLPGNEGRGYVLRRMLRRAVRNVRLLGADTPVMAELGPLVRDLMSPLYPNLASDWSRISAYLAGEEESFLATLRTGTTLFESAASSVREAGGSQVSGQTAFTLHDTHGFPIDLTLEMAAEQGLSVDADGFTTLMAQQRARAQADRAGRGIGHADVSAYQQVLGRGGPTEFTGYAELETPTEVRAVLLDGELVEAAHAGQEAVVVLDRTPFYAESGGQSPDHGQITGHDGAQLQVLDVQRPLKGVIAHRVRVLSGEVRVGAEVFASVDTEWRRGARQAHSGTHVVHAALRTVLGPDALQTGSYNTPGRLRLDFSWPQAVSRSALSEIEEVTNNALRLDLPVAAELMTLQAARDLGALALFGEKYDDVVRVVEIGGEFSRELCGGTHVQSSAQIGLVSMSGESSVGSGVRRVEALVGLDAFRFLARERELVAQVMAAVGAQRAEDVPDRVAGVVARLRETEKELDRLRAAAVLSGAAAIAAAAKDFNGVALASIVLPAGTAAEDARALALDVRGRLGSRAGVVAVAVDGAGTLVLGVSEAGRSLGLAAGGLMRGLAPGARGGGRDDLANGKVTDPGQVAAVLAQVEALIAQRSA